MSNSMMAAVLARLRNTSDEVGATERLVLVLLAESCRRGRITSPGVDEMIELTRVFDRRLRQAIATLAREDQPGEPWLRRVGGGHRGRRAEYELLPGSADGTAPAEAEAEVRFRLCGAQR